MKKILSLILAIILLFSMITLNASAQDEGIFYSGIIQRNDSSFYLAVSVKNNPGIAALRLRLDYNDAARLVGVEDFGVLSGFGASEKADSPVYIQWLSTASADFIENTYIAYCRFDLAEGKSVDDFEYELSAGGRDILNSRLESPAFVFEKGGFLKYDYDGDATVTSADALYILKASIGLIETNELLTAVCDSNDDGILTSEDALYALKVSIGLVHA